MSSPPEGGPVAVRYAQAMHIGVVIILVVWHFGYDVLILHRGWPVYDPRAAAAASWLMLAAVQIVGSVLVLRGALGPAAARMLAAISLGAGVVAVTSYPPGQALSDVSWAWNTVGWFGVMLLMQRPLWELGILLTANTGITVAVLALDGSLDRITTARLITVVGATAGIQMLFALVGHFLVQAARRATELTTARAEHLTRRAMDEAVHASRQRRYEEMKTRIEPLLRGLAEQRLDPTDPVIRRSAGIEAARLRRLFAETDDTLHPLLHELRACADIAERRDVDVTFLCYGDPPALPAAARRVLTEAPLLVLASAATWARLTVLADATEVVIGVIADSPVEVLANLSDSASLSVVHNQEGNQLWVETRWQQPTSRSA